MDRRMFITVAGAAISGGCLENTSTGSAESTEGGRSEDADVKMTNEPAFVPETIEIDAGQTVTWRNESTRLQTVTADEDSLPNGAAYFASGGFSREITASIVFPVKGGLNTEERFSHTFETSGVYEYYSIPDEHLGMGGRVMVR